MEAPGQNKSIRVAVRVRPLLPSDGLTGTSLLELNPSRPNEVVLNSGSDRRAARRYTFDQVFGPDVPQDELYGRAGVSDMVAAVVAGYHATIFAYGQTGSGKTYTMEGYRYTPGGGSGLTRSSSAKAANPAAASSATSAAAAGSPGGRGGAVRAVSGPGGAATAAAAAPARGGPAPQADFGGTPDEQLGLNPRAVRELFEAAAGCRGRRFTIRCSFVQIYREQVYDLLNPATLSALPGSGGGAGGGGGAVRRTATATGLSGVVVGGPLRLRWSSAEEFYLENLFTPEMESAEEAISAFQAGVANKVMSSHRLNAASSRSHCLFTLTVASCPAASPLETRTARLTLVDLAGSERAALTGATEGVLRDESVAINKSLFTLRQVITALTDAATTTSSSPSPSSSTTSPSPQPRTHIPYRDSKLTCLLKHSLGGNSLTLMVACLAPADRFLEENASTLDYAARARRITNQVAVNEDPRSRLIRELRAEVAFLRQQLEAAGLGAGAPGLGAGLGPKAGSVPAPLPPLPLGGFDPSAAAAFSPSKTFPAPAPDDNPTSSASPSSSSSSSDAAAAEAAYAVRLRQAAATDVETLVGWVVQASRLALTSSSALAALRGAYTRTCGALEALRAEAEELRVEDARLRDRVALLEGVLLGMGVGVGGSRSSSASVAAGMGAAAGAQGERGGGGGGGGEWYTASTAALIELEELRRENALLHERLQLFDPSHDPGGNGVHGGGGGVGACGPNSSGTGGRGRGTPQGRAGAAPLPPHGGTSRPGTGSNNSSSLSSNRGRGGLRGGTGTAAGAGGGGGGGRQRALSAGALRPTGISTAGAGGGGSGVSVAMGRVQAAAAAAAAANPFTPQDVLKAVMPPPLSPPPPPSGCSSAAGMGWTSGAAGPGVESGLGCRPATGGYSSTAGGRSGGGSGGGGGGRTLTVDQLRSMLQHQTFGGGSSSSGGGGSGGHDGGGGEAVPFAAPSGGGGGGGSSPSPYGSRPATSSTSTVTGNSSNSNTAAAGRLSELGHAVASRALTSGVRLSTTGRLLPAAPARMAVEAAASSAPGATPLVGGAAGGTAFAATAVGTAPAAVRAGDALTGNAIGISTAVQSTAARISMASPPSPSPPSSSRDEAATLAALLVERNALTRHRLAGGAV